MKLYKYNKLGKPLEYTIEIVESEIHTWKGQVGGKLQHDIKAVTPKANRTLEEQLELEYNSMVSTLKDDGYAETLEASGKDQCGRMKPMLASEFNMKHIQFPCYIQPKFDGVRCLALEVDGRVELVSRNGKTYNIPHVQQYLENNKHLLPLDGELYSDELTFQQIVSAVKRYQPNTDKLVYHVYDTPRDGKFIGRLSHILDLEHPLQSVKTWWVDDEDMLYSFHRKLVNDGYEGSIIRNGDGLYTSGRSKDLIKMKDMVDAEYKIIGYKEGTGRDAGTVIWICAGEKPFNVRPMGSREERKEALLTAESQIGKHLTVRYQELTSDGIPRFPVGVGIRDYE